MKYYAMREKRTGKFATNWKDEDTSPDEGLFFSDKYLEDMEMLNTDDYEVVTLHLESIDVDKMYKFYQLYTFGLEMELASRGLQDRTREHFQAAKRVSGWEEEV